MEEDKMAKTAAETVGIVKEEPPEAEEQTASDLVSEAKEAASAAEEKAEPDVAPEAKEAASAAEEKVEPDAAPEAKETASAAEEKAEPDAAPEAKETARAAEEKAGEPSLGDKPEPAEERSAEAPAEIGTEAAGTDGAPECPLCGWCGGDPFRVHEADYICSRQFRFPPKANAAGQLEAAFSLTDTHKNEFIFLLIFDSAFPELPADGGLPVRVHPVVPSVQELEQMFGEYALKRIKPFGNTFYIDFADGKKLFSDYRKSEGCRKSLTQSLIDLTADWLDDLLKARKPSILNRMRTKLKNMFPGGSKKDAGGEESGAGRRREPAERLHKYIDGRVSQGASANPRCRKVVLSDRALVQIFNESRNRIVTETGGLLLGHYDHGVWYVVEASDPGAGACFEVAYHEADEEYQNHVCAVISRIYKHQLQFLGMWHRHPGSMDVFSGTDDRTNCKYADDVGRGCISALINYDPHFRITFYYVEQINGRAYYTKVDWEDGDDKILNKEITRIATLQEVEARYQ